MACGTIYDFINGATVQLPTVSGASAAVEPDGRHGVRAILSPDESARALIADHARMLTELGRAVRPS